MFLGEYKTKFTGTGRVILPRKFREELGKSKEVILSRGLDGCIWGFEKRRWEEEVRRQLKTSITEEVARNLRRYLFSAAEGLELDSQGRLVIPKALVEFALLTTEAKIIGAGDHFEIWNPSSWEKIVKRLVKGFDRG